MTLAHHPDMTPAPHLFMYDPTSPTRYNPGLAVIKLEYSLKLKTRGPEGPEALT